MLIDGSSSCDLFEGSESCVPHPVQIVGPVSTGLEQIGQRENTAPHCLQGGERDGKEALHAGHMAEGHSGIFISFLSFISL